MSEIKSVLSSIGAYSFAVYLFQWLWYYAWYGVEMVSDPSVSTPGVWAAYLPAYFVCLWVSAALWTEQVEAPLATALRQLLMGPPAKSVAGQPVVPAQRSCLLVHTSRVAAALLVGVGVLSWMHWADYLETGVRMWADKVMAHLSFFYFTAVAISRVRAIPLSRK